MGIPFARPPVGKYRFKEPKPTKPWQGVWDATKLPPKCIQYDRYPVSAVLGEEDCLYLNVYTPKLAAPGAPLLDVLVFIHGGGFMYGASADWGPELILDRDVVLVTINYRLGVMGFLSTEDDVVPGNNGLKDQSLALRWLQGNVAAFGGNPNSVTLLGLSAGGASVHYHYLSPLSQGVFHRGWSMSGSALCPWTQQEAALQKARRIAALVGCPSDDAATTRDLVECLRYRPARAVVAAVPGLQDDHELPFSPFAPVVEPAGTLGAFLDSAPLDVIQSGAAHDLPWMTGVTTEEGLYNAGEFLGEAHAAKLQQLERDWLQRAPLLLDYNYTAPADAARRDALSVAIRERYFGSRPFAGATKEFIAMIGDRIFNTGVEQAAREMAKANSESVFLYEFGYRGEYSLSAAIANGDTTNWGVSHGDDTGYLLKWDLMPTGRTPTEQKLSKQLISFLTTFARTGVPAGLPGAPGWVSVDPAAAALPIIRIDRKAELSFATVPELGSTAFWTSLPIGENQAAADQGERDEL
ncbi:venom carboxylesterase-6-like [Thrips palmi]|uniref:Carboxylic ester hydrolase n=1 Tax=Thrips palmi TaxID=161013 RepID=A0A6P9A3P3_THRPL|nr:venom carboxylesterase-6-like [Thrips palmi]